MTKKRLFKLQPRLQKGAAAIEFALLFLLFFTLFYAMVNYAIVMWMQSAFVHAAEEGARAAIAVDRLSHNGNAAYFSNGVEPEVRRVVGNALHWLPAKPREKVLSAGNGVQVSMSGNQLTVRVVYSNYTADPVLPILTLPVIGQVPRVPVDLAGVAVIEL